MVELWKNIEGYEQTYQVSSLGRIKSLSRKINGTFGGTYNTKERILKPPVYSYGYSVVKLYKSGKALRVGVHVLVARAFISNPENHPIVNHLDGDKQNNSASNLEWTTQQGNHTHAAEHGLKAKGDKHGFAKLTSDKVSQIKRMLINRTPQRQIAKQFNVCQATIKDINRNNTWCDVDAEPEYKYLLG